jgi:hypothetical protein
MRLAPENMQAVAESAFAYAASLPQFGHAEIAIKVQMSERWVSKTVRGWLEKDLVELVQSGHMIRTIWRVKPGAKFALAAKARSPEQNMWTAMRQLKSFTPRDLAAHAATEETAVTLEAAQEYCRALMGGGYLAVARKAIPGKTEAIYRLTKNTGPRAPREKRVRALVDANTEQTILIGGGA